MAQEEEDEDELGVCGEGGDAHAVGTMNGPCAVELRASILRRCSML